MVPVAYYLILAAVLFSIGVAAFLIKRNIISIFMSIELMLNAVNLTFVAFLAHVAPGTGQIFVFFVMVVAAAEAAVGLAIIIAIFRTRQTLNVDQINRLEQLAKSFKQTFMPTSYLWFIPLLPFAGFLINGTVGRKLPRALVSAVALIFTAIPAALVLWLWITMKSAGAPDSILSNLGPWIQITGFHVDFAFAVDHLTLIMLGVVTGVGFLIHVYSVGYMAHEEGYWRFFAYLNLFMFFMLVLVLSSSFLLLFVGWEGVGLASYLLIGFYFKKDSAANAGKKAFVVNRIGDFGFLLAMFLLVSHFGSLDFAKVFSDISANPTWEGGTLTTIALLLVLGAVGKSAQIPLYVWLPDAMEGPTPVSALIHAATMVTAGIYMIARCHTLFDRSPLALTVIACIAQPRPSSPPASDSSSTTSSAYSPTPPSSQLGYMSWPAESEPTRPGIFHLMTHAFFKALLFLAAGSVIHALSGEQDMRKMGGLRTRIPVTFWT